MKEVDIEKLEDFFFEAAMASYASGVEPKSISAFHAKGYYYSKVIEKDLYEYQDVYFDAGRGKSFGFTIISINSRCVWTMHYHGECNKKYVGSPKIKVMNFLKKALLNAYEKKKFFGGRGYIFQKGQLAYDNYCNKRNFEDFSGRERITEISSLKSLPIFYHEYEGGLVV